MLRNRVIWLLCWLGSLVFLLFYQRWLAWLLLAGVLLVPLFSLAVSLPFMITAHPEAQFPERITVGTALVPKLTCKTHDFAPQWGFRLRVTHAITGKTLRLRPGDPLPTHRCGALLCTLTHAKIYDYLGLFALPLRVQKEHQILVEPMPEPLPLWKTSDAEPTFAWKPKNGGFSENHELRLYVPGDDLRQIHWKLSAKTGKLIIREPMVPDAGQVLVHLELKGSDEQIDRRLGHLLWLGQRLAQQQVPFDLVCLTGQGTTRFSVTDEQSLRQCLDILLQCPMAPSGSLPEPPRDVTRLYKLGGDGNEN